jgi:hypothetical protein
MVISPVHLACARVDEPRGTLPICPAGRPHSCGGCCGLLLSLLLSPRRDSEGWMRTKIVLETPEHPRVVRSPAFELALSVGRSGWGPGRPPTKILSTTSVVNGTVSYLNGCLPRAERAAARSGSGGGLALDCLSPGGDSWRQARRCPKLRKTCVLSVWMRSVDDWPLAKILTRFLGVSCGR